MKHHFVCLLVIGLVTLASISANAMLIQKKCSKSSSEFIDAWPMFLHDAKHTGHSSFDAPDTNHTKWVQTTPLGGITSSPAIIDGKMYIGSFDGRLYCFDAKTGDQQWYYQTENWVTSSPAVADGILFVGSWDGYIYSIDAENGNLLWSYMTIGGFFNWVVSSPVVSNERMYIGAWNGVVYCFDANPRNDEIDEGINDPPGVAYDLIWTYQTEGSVESSPAVVNEKVYVGSNDGYLYCLDAQSGEFLWRYDAGYYIQQPSISIIDATPPIHVSSWIWSSPSVSNGRVYFSEGRGTIYCLDATTGRKLWSYATGEWGSSSSPVVAEERVYIGTQYQPDYQDPYGTLYCFDARSGLLLWSYQTANFILGSPAVADKKVYIGSFDNTTYCLNARTGSLIWKYITDGVIRTSPAVACGRIYIACYHELPGYESYGKIYCFEDL